MDHAITVGDVIVWLANGAITVIFTTVVVLALKNVYDQYSNKPKGD